MFDKIKFTLIEYVHLLLLIYIIFALFINNLPINIQYDKILDEYIPKTISEDMAINTLGIKDPKNSKVYSALTVIYSYIRASISPDLKALLLKIVMIIFIVILYTDEKYINAILDIGIVLFSLGLILYIIFWSILNYAPEKFKKNMLESLNVQIESGWFALLPTVTSLVCILLIYFILSRIHSNPNSDHRLINFLKNSSIITISISLILAILYFRIDGIVYFFRDSLWHEMIQPWLAEMKKNLITNDNIGNNWFHLIFYILFFIPIIFIVERTISKNMKKSGENTGTGTDDPSKIKQFGEGILKYHFLNNLIDKTNHPILISFAYIWYFLIYPKGNYKEYNISYIILLQILDVIYIKKDEITSGVKTYVSNNPYVKGIGDGIGKGIGKAGKGIGILGKGIMSRVGKSRVEQPAIEIEMEAIRNNTINPLNS